MFTVRNSSWGKVMFYTCLSVILFTGGGACMAACVAGGHAWQDGHVWWGGMQDRRCMVVGCAWQGACVAGGMHGKVGDMCGKVGGHVWQGGGHVWWGDAWQGGHVWWGVCVAGETATAAYGTHPTRMHSCLYNEFINAM